MVQWQLCTVEHLMNSGFGRPFPRHGLQLLFWFANQCVTCEHMNLVAGLKLVSDCQPENGSYGFHLFGNIEELLPVLNRPRRRKKQVAYYEVGNLNTETYPAAANLPPYVRENYGQGGHHGYSNIDRIIISYQLKTGVVEMVYVTEHDGEDFGRFCAERTHEISFKLIEALQSPQMDLTTFLIRTGYYVNIEQLYYPEPAAQQIFDTMQTYNRSVARSRSTFSDNFRFFVENLLQRIGVGVEPFSYDRQADYVVNITSNNSSGLTNYSDVPRKCRKQKAAKRSRALRQSYWPSAWEQTFKGYDEGDKRDKGGSAFFKLLLSAGALCLAAVCFSWLRSSCKADVKENTLKMIPWRSPIYRHTHVMLDYVY